MKNFWMGTLSCVVLGAGLMTPGAAYASEKPTLVLMHRNMNVDRDETAWLSLNDRLAMDGYKVVSVALPATENAVEDRKKMKTLLAKEDKTMLLLVGTAEVRGAMERLALDEPGRVEGAVYVSLAGKPFVAPMGKKALARDKFTKYEIAVVPGKAAKMTVVRDVTHFEVKQSGTSALGKEDDMVEALEKIDKMK